MVAGRTFIIVSFLCVVLLSTSCHSPTSTDVPLVRVLAEDRIPELRLYGAYPNPFSGSTSIAYEILNGSADRIECNLYNSSGIRVQSYALPSDDSASIAAFHSRSFAFSEGYSECRWEGSSVRGQVPNGVYFLEIHLEKNGIHVRQHVPAMRILR